MILLHFYYFSSVVSNRFLVFLSFITNKEQSHCARAGVSSDHCSYIINDLCLYLIFFFYFAGQKLSLLQTVSVTDKYCVTGRSAGADFFIHQISQFQKRFFCGPVPFLWG